MMEIIPNTMKTIVCCGISPNRGIWRKPSIAEVIEIGGVIIPSASNAAPPIMAAITSHLLLLRTSAYKEKMPPSPRLSAFKVSITYFIVVCSVNVQMIQERLPMINCSETIFEPIIALNTYSGEVPISPKIIPRATNNPNGETFLIFKDIDATRSSFRNDGSLVNDLQK